MSDPFKGAKLFRQRCAQCHTVEVVSHPRHLYTTPVRALKKQRNLCVTIVAVVLRSCIFDSFEISIDNAA